MTVDSDDSVDGETGDPVGTPWKARQSQWRVQMIWWSSPGSEGESRSRSKTESVSANSVGYEELGVRYRDNVNPGTGDWSL